MYGRTPSVDLALKLKLNKLTDDGLEPKMGAWRNSTETQQSGQAPRCGPEVKNRSNAKDGAPERLRCGKSRRR